MFTRRSTDRYRTVAPGIELRTLCHGAATLMAEFRLAAGHDLPTQSHPHEQTGYLVSSRIQLRIGAETNTGRRWDSVAIEVFSPVREDLLPDAVAR